jgi:hypothetical protein
MTMSQLTQEEIEAGFFPIPDNGRLMTKEQFRDAVRLGVITKDAGGMGYYATASARTGMEVAFDNFLEADGEDKDRFFKMIPELATHVVWFEKGEGVIV